MSEAAESPPGSPRTTEVLQQAPAEVERRRPPSKVLPASQMSESVASSPSKGSAFQPRHKIALGSHTQELHRRTLRFAVSVVGQLNFPDNRLFGGHTVGDGYLFKLEGVEMSAEDVEKLQQGLEELVAAGARISQVKKSWAEAVAYFEKHSLHCARQLLETQVTESVDLYECRGVCRLNLFEIHATAGALAADYFQLIPCQGGFVATYTEEYQTQQVLIDSMTDHCAFTANHNVTSVGALNTFAQVGRGRQDFVLHCEFRQESKLAEIAQRIQARAKEGKQVKLVCIAGPTSSGKTTFATKLSMYLKNLGFPAKPLTVDHYYHPLDRQPKYQARQQRSDVDYDSIESMDVDLIGEHLNLLIAGKEVLTPVYDMKTGYRVEPGLKFEAMPDNGILVIEGLHALNPEYTKVVDPNKVFKIFLSPMTSLQVDDCNTVRTTDHRLLRRTCRDYLFRGHSASRTLSMWGNVRKGEGIWIFPHQNSADYTMNSAGEYEIPMLKTYIEPLFRGVRPDDPNFEKAQEILALLGRFVTWPPQLTPSTSLMREFIGEGAFDMH